MELVSEIGWKVDQSVSSIGYESAVSILNK